MADKMVAATSLTLEEGVFMPGDELPASALKYLKDELVAKESDFKKAEANAAKEAEAAAVDDEEE